MISYDPNNSSIIIDGNGVRHSVFEGAVFSRLVATMTAQRAAAGENQNAADAYSAALGSAQTSINAGRHADAPAKPLMKTVTDEGTVTMGPFVPPLADLKPLVVTAPDSGSIVTPGVTNQADVQFAMIQAIFNKVCGG
ncbi:MAG: hypothetical protein NT045_05495 [Candidatus Aureabacteria bacterium]|nr:hypothetical protein [Candidatus Auribacterota bacterium]